MIGANPVIINPTTAKKIAIAIHNEENFYQQNYDFIPFLNIYDNQTPRNLVKRFTPSLDLFNKSLYGDLFTTSQTRTNYYYGMIKDLSINPIPFYKSVDTFTWSKYIASPQNNVLMTEGTMNLMVLIPFQQGLPNSKFLQQIWRLAVYWFVPFFISADVYPQNIGGPLFVNKFTITARDSVDISLSFKGGSSYETPPFENLISPYDKDLDEIGVVPANEQLRGVFRTAKNYDCFFVLAEAESLQQGIYTSYNIQKEDLFVQGNRILDMSLTVDNNLETIFTANNGFAKNLVDGMRYISLKNRKVSGELKFLAAENLQRYFSVSKNRTLILFFGGPFYFPMKNVFFDAFDLKINADESSYTHTIKFTALLQESSSPDYYQQNEFDVNFNGLLHAPRGEIYAKPQ